MPAKKKLTEAIDGLLKEAYRPDGPGAVAVLAENGRTLYRGAVGLAQLSPPVALEADMTFPIASLTKPFTAQAVLMLAEAGQLSLGDPVTRHLSLPAGLSAVTLAHLLTHTSGLVNYTTLPEWWAAREKDLAPAELIALFKDKPLASPPGARWAYNNSGYVLLGAVIEAVTGRPYGRWIAEQIFGPLGMSHSGCESPSRRAPGPVKPYQAAGESFTDAADVNPTQTYAAGGLFSTADDLARWSAVLFSGRTLKPATLRRALTPCLLNDGSRGPYGFGWFVAERGGRTEASHLGVLTGVAHFMVGVPAAGLFAAVLSNRANQMQVPDQLARAILARARE